MELKSDQTLPYPTTDAIKKAMHETRGYMGQRTHRQSNDDAPNRIKQEDCHRFIVRWPSLGSLFLLDDKKVRSLYYNYNPSDIEKSHDP